MPEERITSDVLEELLHDNSLEHYDAQHLAQPIGLVQYASSLLEEKHLKKAQVIKDAGLNQTFGYQILAGQRKPTRNKVIQLAFGLHATLRETQRLLKHAGLSELYVKDRRDAIIILCIKNGLSLYQANDELYRLGEHTITESSK